MKKILYLFVAVMMLGAFLVPTSVTQAQTAPPMESSLQIQNLDNVNSATIYIYYYNPDGTLTTLPNGLANPVLDTIGAGTSNTYLTVHPGVGFKGSAVVSSDRPIAIISNLTIAATNRALGTYVGAGSGGSTLYFPLVDRRNNVSIFSVQNAGTGDAVVKIDFVPSGPSFADLADINVTIKEGAAKTYSMTDLTAAPWLGSVTVTASVGSVVGVLANTNQVNVASPMNAVYNGTTAGSTSVVLPLIMEANNGNRTGTSCQNLGPNPAKITITYASTVDANGNPVYPARPNDTFDNVDVPINGIVTKLLLDTGAPTWVGSAIATVNNGSKIACVVNQSRPSLRRSSIYEGFDPNAATGTVILPLIMTKNGGATKTFTNFSVASTDGTNVTVTCDWRPREGYNDIANTTKGPGPVLIFPQQVGFSAGDTVWVGSAVCTEANGKKIVAVVNQSREFLPAGTLRDVTSAYDAIPQ